MFRSYRIFRYTFIFAWVNDQRLENTCFFEKLKAKVSFTLIILFTLFNLQTSYEFLRLEK
jgi:hypothetical protein